MRRALFRPLAARSLKPPRGLRPRIIATETFAAACSTPPCRAFSSAPSPVWAKRKTIMEERVTDLSPKCQSCGTPFQEKNPDARGFFKEQRIPTRGTGIKTATLDKYNQLMANLGDEEQRILLQERKPDLDLQEQQPVEAASNNKHAVMENLQLSEEKGDKVMTLTQSDARKDLINRGLCTSCREVKGGKYKHFIDSRLPDETILARIPKDATIIHTISGMDFPASVNPNIKDIAAGRKIMWVVTKADMIVPNNVKASERLLPYVQEELSRMFGADPLDVFVVSAKRCWCLGTLFSALPSNGYLFGYANTGKSSLAQALAAKDINRTIIPAQLAQRSKGVNEIPGMTREEISYVLKGKRVTDLPPVGQNRDTIYSVVKQESIKDLVRGKPFMRMSGLLTAKRVVLSKPGNTLSIGGLVFIRFTDPTERLSLIAWAPCARHDDTVLKFRDYEKAVSVAAEQKDFHSDWFFSKPYEQNAETGELAPIKIMDLKISKGGSDLSILGVGHVQLRANGRIPAGGCSAEVYAIPGVHVVEKVPLLPFLQDFQESSASIKKEYRRKR